MNNACAAGEDFHFDLGRDQHGIQPAWLAALQLTKAIDYSSQAIDQDGQDGAYAREEEYGRHGELDDMGDIGNVVECLQGIFSASNDSRSRVIVLEPGMLATSLWRLRRYGGKFVPD